MALTVEIPPEVHDVTHPLQNPTRSEGWRCAITPNPPRTTLQRSIGLLDRDDEDFRAGLQVALVAFHVSNDGRIGGGKDFFFSILVFHRQRLPINNGDNLFNVRVGHCALGPKIPWVVSFSGSAHCLSKDMYFECALAAVGFWHRRERLEHIS